MLHLQGFLEQTYLFYGFYNVDKIHFSHITYNLALAYLLVTIGYLFLSLIWIVKRYEKGKLVRNNIYVMRCGLECFLLFKVCCGVQT